MVSETGFKSIEELVKSLAGKVGELAVGSAQVKDIETMCDESRELYERLVVLRHRGREALLEGNKAISVELVQPEQASEPVEPTPEPVVAEPDVSVPDVQTEAKPQAMTEMTLDFSPPEGPAGQTSLIDAIAEEEVDKRTETDLEHKTEENADGQESLGEKLEGASIENIGKAIGLNQKFMFISQVFKGNKDAFATAIEKLDSMAEQQEALEYAKELTAHIGDEEEELLAKDQFVDLVERRFQ